jgi:glyoxylase-like metal-dependent hydrolase (beta-lactamase superfamily II)
MIETLINLLGKDHTNKLTKSKIPFTAYNLCLRRRMTTRMKANCTKLVLVFTVLISLVSRVTVVAQPPNCEDVLQARLDCYDTDGPCDPLPVTPSAFGPPPDPVKGYVIQPLRENIYAIGDGAYWFMIALAPTRNRKTNTPYEVAIFDFPEGNFVIRDSSSGATIGSKITAAIDEVVFDMHGLLPENIDRVKMVYSHQHMDHIGAATIVYDHIVDLWDPRTLDVIAHAEVLEEFETRIAASYFSHRAPLPNVLVHDHDVEHFTIGLLFDFSLTPLRGHSDDKDLVVFFEKDGSDPAIMMFVDVVFPGWAPFYSFAISTDVFAFIDAHEFLLDNFDLGDDGIFVGGHLSRLGTREDIVVSSEFTQAIMDGALKGLQTVDINPIAGASGVFDPTNRNVGNSWLLFDLYFKQVVKVCVKEVVAEWGCKLGAVDIVINSHCLSAQSFWRVDY